MNSRFTPAITLLLPLLAACGPGLRPTTSATDTTRDEPVVRFLAFGDAGTASKAQYAVGQAMNSVCAERGCDFAIMLGDNFYPSGVDSVDDPQFESKFEKPYAFLDLPVYVALGNHDNGRNGAGGENFRGDFQVAYSSRARRLSDKWRMPARYYNFTAPLNTAPGTAPLAEFFALDSTPLIPYVPDPDPKWSVPQYGLTQLHWFQAALQSSRARWRIAFAHHPYLSNGSSGNAKGWHWKSFLDQSLCREGVDLFLAGHDHDLEWEMPTAGCGRTQFIVSGAAANTAPFRPQYDNPAYWQADWVLGFFWIELRGQQMTVAAYTLDRNTVRLPTDPQGHSLAAFERTVPRPSAAPAPGGH